MYYRWIDIAGKVIASFDDSYSAGRFHMQAWHLAGYQPVTCINPKGEDVTDMVIVASVAW